MLRYTYELYIDQGDGERQFEALTCLERDLIPAVKRVLAERTARTAEVHRMGKHLFTLGVDSV